MKPSEAFALDSWLSYYPDGMTYQEIIEAMTDREHAHKAEHIDVWEIVEDHDYPYIAQLIEMPKCILNKPQNWCWQTIKPLCMIC